MRTDRTGRWMKTDYVSEFVCVCLYTHSHTHIAALPEDGPSVAKSFVTPLSAWPCVTLHGGHKGALTDRRWPSGTCS